MSEMQEHGSATGTCSRSEIERLADRLAWCEKDVRRKDAELARKEAQCADLSRRLAAVVSADNARQVHFDNMRRLNDALRQQRDALQRQRDALQRQLAEIVESRGWRLLTTVHKLRLRVLGNAGSR
jgi:septal ring factor EnvC (AmiA/AmiB activator)